MVRCFLSVLGVVKKKEGGREGGREKGKEEKREGRDIMAFSFLKILSYSAVFSWI